MAMLADDQAAVLVPRHAIRTNEGSGRRIVQVVPAGLPEQGHFAAGSPFAHFIARDIAEQQVSSVEPDGTFGETETSGKLLDFRASGHDGVERRVGLLNT